MAMLVVHRIIMENRMALPSTEARLNSLPNHVLESCWVAMRLELSPVSMAHRMIQSSIAYRCHSRSLFGSSRFSVVDCVPVSRDAIIEPGRISPRERLRATGEEAKNVGHESRC